MSNANFVVDQASGITLGLKSHERYNGDWCPATYVDGRGVYHAHAGPGRRPETGHTAWLKFKGTTWSYYYAYDLGENDPALYGIRVRLDFNPATVPAARNTWYTYEIFGHRNGGEDLPGLPSARAADSQSFGWDWWGDFADGEHLNFKGNPAPEGGNRLITNSNGYDAYAWDTEDTTCTTGTTTGHSYITNTPGVYEVDVEIYLLSDPSTPIVSSSMTVIVSSTHFESPRPRDAITTQLSSTGGCTTDTLPTRAEIFSCTPYYLGEFPLDGEATEFDRTVYPGSGDGNLPTNMVVNTAGGIKLGLKSQERYTGDWCPATFVDGRGVYLAHSGPGRRPGNGATDWTKFKATTWSYTFAYDLGVHDPSLYGIRVRLDFDPATEPADRDTWLSYTVFGHQIAGVNNPGLPSAKGFDSQSFGWDWWGDYSDGEYLNFKGNPAPEGGNRRFINTANYNAYAWDVEDSTCSSGHSYITNTPGVYEVDVEIFLLSNPSTAIVSTAMTVIVSSDHFVSPDARDALAATSATGCNGEPLPARAEIFSCEVSAPTQSPTTSAPTPEPQGMGGMGDGGMGDGGMGDGGMGDNDNGKQKGKKLTGVPVSGVASASQTSSVLVVVGAVIVAAAAAIGFAVRRRRSAVAEADVEEFDAPFSAVGDDHVAI